MKSLKYLDLWEDRLKDVIEWLTSDRTDNLLYKEKIEPFLIIYARFIIRAKLRGHMLPEIREDICMNMVIHAGSNLHKFDITRSSKTLSNFLYTIMLRYMVRNAKKLQRKKRVLMVLTELGDVVVNKCSLPVNFDSERGDDFIPFLITYWETNLDLVFTNSKMKKYKIAKSIVELLKNPELMGDNSLTYYLAKKHNATREYVRLVYLIFREHKKEVLVEMLKSEPMNYPPAKADGFSAPSKIKELVQ